MINVTQRLVVKNPIESSQESLHDFPELNDQLVTSEADQVYKKIYEDTCKNLIDYENPNMLSQSKL